METRTKGHRRAPQRLGTKRFRSSQPSRTQDYRIATIVPNKLLVVEALKYDGNWSSEGPNFNESTVNQLERGLRNVAENWDIVGTPTAITSYYGYGSMTSALLVRVQPK